MRIVSGIIMLLGAFLTFSEFMSSTSSPQQAASLVYVVGAYVTGRALENFVSKSPEEVAKKMQLKLTRKIELMLATILI